MKDILFGDAAQERLLEGVNLVARAVETTLGPKGKNIILSRDTAPPVVTNDGVSVASFFNKVEDPYVNTGVQMIKEVAAQQNEPGDGTTTATILAAELVNEGVKFAKAGYDPLEIREGMNEAARRVIAEVKACAREVKTEAELIQIATVSVENEEMGAIIGSLMHEVGKDGAITVETEKDAMLEKDMTRGLKFDAGFVSPYFMTNPYRQESVIEDVPVLVTNHRISINEEILPIVEDLISRGIKGLVIICDHIKGEALNTTIMNTVNNKFHFLVTTLPGLDEVRTHIGQDIAVAVGAEFIESTITPLEEVTFEQLGSANRVISKAEYTVIVEGDGKQSDVDERIKVLKEQMKEVVSDYDRDQLKERIARLSGGIGVIRVGAATEQELTYKKHKIEDALAATRAAAEEGIVAGGGVTLLRIAHKLNEGYGPIGERIVYEAVGSLIKKIARNAGKNPDTIAEKVLDSKNISFGWNAKTNEYVDMFEAGIVDPVKVTHKAVENAVSMATMFMTSGAVIVEMPVEKIKSREERLQETKGRG